MACLPQKRRNELSLFTKADSSHSFGMTEKSGMTESAFGMTENGRMTEPALGMTEKGGMTQDSSVASLHRNDKVAAISTKTVISTTQFVISTEGRNLFRHESLDHPDYHNFEVVIEKASKACFNSGHRLDDHFVDVTEMIEIGKGGQRPVKTVLAKTGLALLLSFRPLNLSFRPKGEISCPECIATTYTY